MGLGGCNLGASNNRDEPNLFFALGQPTVAVGWPKSKLKIMVDLSLSFIVHKPNQEVQFPLYDINQSR